MNINTNSILTDLRSLTEEHKDSFTLDDLLNASEVKQDFLWEPYFPQKGTGVLAGQPGCGKGMLSLYLSLTIAFGKDKFLDLPLKTRYGSSLFIETEDGHEEIAFRTQKILRGSDFQKVNNAGFFLITPSFTNNHDKEKFFQRLSNQLQHKPADLVVISSLGDIFMGDDMNNNLQMRQTASRFDMIAKQHDTFVLLIHHINKVAYNKKPNQADIQGGSGLIQKVRFAANLIPGEKNKRYFAVTKGNQISKSYRDNALSLDFDENTFRFINNGKNIPVDQISSDDTSSKNVKIDWEIVFKDKDELKRSEILKICKDIFGKGRATVDENLRKAVEDGILINRIKGTYCLVK